MTARPRAALLIDADNLAPEGMEKAFADLERRGLQIAVLRAYGSPETLSAAREFLQHHAGRAVVNQGKGTTDAALVVDAMDLLHGGDLPATVAIGSSDSDFAPLAVRLRESGRFMLCYAHRHKAALTGLERLYHEVVALEDAPARDRSPAPANAPAKAPARAAARAPAAKSPAKPPPARKAAAPGPARPTKAEEVWGLLAGVPGFLESQTLELNSVVKLLRDAGLMPKTAGASTFFKKLALPVELTPLRQPNKLRRVRDGEAAVA